MLHHLLVGFLFQPECKRFGLFLHQQAVRPLLPQGENQIGGVASFRVREPQAVLFGHQEKLDPLLLPRSQPHRLQAERNLRGVEHAPLRLRQDLVALVTVQRRVRQREVTGAKTQVRSGTPRFHFELVEFPVPLVLGRRKRQRINQPAIGNRGVQRCSHVVVVVIGHPARPRGDVFHGVHLEARARGQAHVQHQAPRVHRIHGHVGVVQRSRHAVQFVRKQPGIQPQRLQNGGIHVVANQQRKSGGNPHQVLASRQRAQVRGHGLKGVGCAVHALRDAELLEDFIRAPDKCVQVGAAGRKRCRGGWRRNPGHVTPHFGRLAGKHRQQRLRIAGKVVQHPQFLSQRIQRYSVLRLHPFQEFDDVIACVRLVQRLRVHLVEKNRREIYGRSPILRRQVGPGVRREGRRAAGLYFGGIAREKVDFLFLPVVVEPEFIPGHILDGFAVAIAGHHGHLNQSRGAAKYGARRNCRLSPGLLRSLLRRSAAAGPAEQQNGRQQGR